MCRVPSLHLTKNFKMNLLFILLNFSIFMCFRKPQNWKPVLIVFLVFICGQFSGFAVVTAYTVDIFNEAATNLDSNNATVIVGVVR